MTTEGPDALLERLREKLPLLPATYMECYDLCFLLHTWKRADDAHGVVRRAIASYRCLPRAEYDTRAGMILRAAAYLSRHQPVSYKWGPELLDEIYFNE